MIDDDLCAGQSIALKRCVEINGTGLARILGDTDCRRPLTEMESALLRNNTSSLADGERSPPDNLI